MNRMPEKYRQVSVMDVDFPLSEPALRQHLLGREVYRRTAYVIARKGDETALLHVEKESTEPLFSPVTAVTMLATPAECATIVDPDVDCGVPSQLGAAARRVPEARCVVVEGRYRHISFILDPKPVRIAVHDVVPPEPAKLLDQARRVLDVAEDLPPVELVPDLFDIRTMMQSSDMLLPCRGAGEETAGVTISYLDERPPHRDWVLVGCERSRQLHEWFYGESPAQQDFCPRNHHPGKDVLLTKCCLIEEGLEVHDRVVFVPWGADLATVGQGLRAALAIAEAALPADTSAIGQ